MQKEKNVTVLEMLIIIVLFAFSVSFHYAD